jgi:hypothetical protein
VAGVLKPANDIYEKIPEISAETAPAHLDHPYATPAETIQNKSPKSKDVGHSPPASRLQHHYQDLDDFTSVLNKQLYQSLDRSGVVNVHPKHSSVAPRKYETLTLGRKAKNSEYQKLHLYANVEVKGNK